MINKCRIGDARAERAQSFEIFLHLKDVIYGWGVIAIRAVWFSSGPQ